jgi:hypothetical protein
VDDAGVISFSNHSGLSLLAGAGDGQHAPSDDALDVTNIEVEDRIGVGWPSQ